MIQQENYMRLALVLQNSNAHTVKTNIVKIIRATMVETGNCPLNLTDLSSQINNLYSLEFDPSELHLAIKESKYAGFQINENDDPVYTRFSLVPEMYLKTQQRIKPDVLDTLIESFIAFCKDVQISTNECKQLILTFLYQAFASDAETIQSLLKADKNKILNYQSFIEFDDDQKIIINLFLNWHDDEKDKFVYNAVSCGYEFCMLGMRKDSNSLGNIFQGKKFYLDSNIVFRLMGLNQIERQMIIRSFIDRCQQANIELKYTNFTVGEIESTIDYRVQRVKRFYGANPPISRQALEELSDKYANLDFLESYGSWTKNAGNKVGDYASFAEYLKQEAHHVLAEFKLEVRTSAAKSEEKKDEFSQLFKEFESYKKHRYKLAYEGNIRVDIENYMFIMELYYKRSGTSIVDVNEYFVTADHSLVNWARERVPHVLPVFVLPSVWYSLLLKIRGRSDNDYRAFSQFLNLRLSEQSEADPRKEQALKAIIEMSETSSNKEAIIYQVSRILRDKARHYDDVAALVEEGQQSAIDQQVEHAVMEKERNHTQLVAQIHDSHDAQLKDTAKERYSEGANNREQEILERIKMQAPTEARKKRKSSIIKLTFFWILGVLLGLISFIISTRYTGTLASQIVSFTVPNALAFLTFILNFGPIKKWRDGMDIEKNKREYIYAQCESLGISLKY